MSKRNPCHDGKQTFHTLESAQTAICQMTHRRKKQGKPIVTFLRAYKCSICGKFHYGRTRNIDWSQIRGLKE